MNGAVYVGDVTCCWRVSSRMYEAASWLAVEAWYMVSCSGAHPRTRVKNESGTHGFHCSSAWATHYWEKANRYCDAPAEIFKLPASAGESCESAEGFPTPVTSPLSPPKPPRTRVKQYSWRNSSLKKEVCM